VVRVRCGCVLLGFAQRCLSFFAHLQPPSFKGNQFFNYPAFYYTALSLPFEALLSSSQTFFVKKVLTQSTPYQKIEHNVCQNNNPLISNRY